MLTATAEAYVPETPSPRPRASVARVALAQREEVEALQQEVEALQQEVEALRGANKALLAERQEVQALRAEKEGLDRVVRALLQSADERAAA